MAPQAPQKAPHILTRARIWYAVLLCIFGIILVRLFYLQVIRHDYYKREAISGQFKQFEIPAERGSIEAHNGDSIVPIVLNEERFNVIADPVLIDDPEGTAETLQKAIGGNLKEYISLMEADSRYAVLKKKVSRKQKALVDELELKGIATRAVAQRVYPQGTLAAQLLGFVNDEGKGTYGIEQYLNKQLKGENGQLKAVTDASGVPLAASNENIAVEPRRGDRVILTIDIAMQRQLESILKRGLDRAQSKSGSALIMDPETGAIKAMANYPTYKPAEFFKVKDAKVFNNHSVSSPLEVGSIMKPLTASAALDSGSVSTNQSYFDPGFFTVDGKKITNVEEVAGAGQRRVVDILRLSLNTGATWLLQQMGDGKINEKARTTWYNYMHDHFRLGQTTGIEQGYEQPGTIPKPNQGFGLNIQYANTAFGQGMTATPLQMGAAISSVINGGNYYRPHLVDKRITPDNRTIEVEPEVVGKDTVSAKVGKTIKGFMEEVVKANYQVYGMKKLYPQYSIGGKTGTAQISRPEGGYYEDKFNGMFMGFIGGDKPEYVIVVRVNEPGIGGYAGSRAAGPVFTDTIEMLINNYAIPPKS